jgi:hypothetical protein
MFGSTVEFVLRAFTDKFNKFNKVNAGGLVLSDGSMHSFKKAFHPVHLNSITPDAKVDISTPIYPFKEHHFPEILQAFYDNELVDQAVILYANSLRAAELNLLFQYHKIAVGKKINLGLDIFCNGNTHNIINWNQNYTHWDQMQPWELREWFSLFYVPWVQEWIESQHQAPDTFLKVHNTDMLYDTKNTCRRIFKFLNLTETGDLDSFVDLWSEKQQYIVDEFNLLDQICKHTVDNTDFTWDPINIIAEAIVQQRLRALGYEIRCDGLNTFPTDSKTLYSKLERC